MINKFLLLTSLALLGNSAFAYDAQVCKNQKQIIEKQIQEAKQFNNEQRTKSLEKSLERIKKVCSKHL